MFQIFLQHMEASANPLFFDSLFPPQSTTPESHISDYRGQKRANSQQADLNGTLLDDGNNANVGNGDLELNGKQEQMQQQQEKEKRQRNVEFYADLIGKFVGTVRSSITNLVDAVRMNRQKNQREQLEMRENQQKNEAEKLKSEETMKMMQQQQQQPRTINIQKIRNKNQKQMMENSIKSSASVSPINPPHNSKTSGIELKSMEQTALNGKADEHVNQGNEKLNTLIDSQPMNEENHYAKQKRSDKTIQSFIDGTNHENEIVESLPQLDGSDESDNHLTDSTNGRKSKLLQMFLSFILTPIITPVSQPSSSSPSPSDDPKEEMEMEDEAVKQINSEQMNRKLFNLNLSINDSNNNEPTDINEGENLKDSTSNDDSKLSLQLLLRSPTKNYQINSTIVSPFQVLRLLHQRMHNRTDKLYYQKRITIQNAFYRYARLYLIARRGYKSAKNSGAGTFETTELNRPENIQTISQEISKARQARLDSDIDFDDVDDDDIIQNVDFLLDDDDVVTNDGRVNEAFAILLLEIFGAIYALTIGAIAQFQLLYGKS